jgi:HSP20 family protein
MFPMVRTNGRNLFSPFADFSSELDRVFNGGLVPAAGTMPVDIREEGDNLILEAELPGVPQEEVQITVENGTLSIAVNRKNEAQDACKGYCLRERRTANVTRTFRLPETSDLDKVEATLDHGLLTLRIPKKAEAKPRQIQVK